MRNYAQEAVIEYSATKRNNAIYLAWRP